MILLKNNHYEERIFSTGNSELDDILEEVYCSGIEDGYDYAQKEFTNSVAMENKILDNISERVELDPRRNMRDTIIGARADANFDTHMAGDRLKRILGVKKGSKKAKQIDKAVRKKYAQQEKAQNKVLQLLDKRGADGVKKAIERHKEGIAHGLRGARSIVKRIFRKG